MLSVDLDAEGAVRLAPVMLWLGGTNVYDGNTIVHYGAQPGESWHTERDLTDYSALLTQPQTTRLDPADLDGRDTFAGGTFASIDLLFYPIPAGTPATTLVRRPDRVLPMAADASGGVVDLADASQENSGSFVLPRNIERAYLDVLVQGAGSEEFWYACLAPVPSLSMELCAGSVLREVEISLDGQPAGIAPVIPRLAPTAFDPSLWRQISATQTLNTLPYRVDLTAFAAQLDDGQPHRVALSVWNAHEHFATTATLLLYLDAGSTQVTGALLQNTLAPAPQEQAIIDPGVISVTDKRIGVTTLATHVFSQAGYVITSHGRIDTSLTQSLTFSNVQQLSQLAELTGPAPSLSRELTQDTRLVSALTVTDGTDLLGETRVLDFPLMLQSDYSPAPDGSAEQTTLIQQGRGAARLISLNNRLLDLESTLDETNSADTLHLDMYGNGVGNEHQRSTQRYGYFDSLGGFYARVISVADGLIDSVSDGDGDSAAVHFNQLPWNRGGSRFPAFVLQQLSAD